MREEPAITDEMMSLRALEAPLYALGGTVWISPAFQPIDNVIGQRAEDANREPGP